MKTLKIFLSLCIVLLIGAAAGFVLGVSPMITMPIVFVASLLVPNQKGILAFAATINLADLKSEFGTYIGTNEQDILKLLTQPTETIKYMTSKFTRDLKWRAAKAYIDSIVQGFQKAWTPKGTAVFTPIEIEQRRHKFDVEFYPDEVFESWLGFLADESKSRAEWPISRYIIEQLIIPKVDEDRELKIIGIGEYASISEGVAQATGLSADGFVTILQNLKDGGTSNVNFINTDLETFTDTNIFEMIENFAKQVSYLYRNRQMRLFLNTYWYMAYHLRRRDLHGLDTNYNGMKDVVEGTNLILTPLPSMGQKNLIFATPKDNFIRVLNLNEGASNIFFETIDRKLKVWGDWHEAPGFAIEEAIFAHVPGAGSESM